MASLVGRRTLLIALVALLGGVGCGRDAPVEQPDTSSRSTGAQAPAPVHDAVGLLDELAPEERGPYLTDEGHGPLPPPGPDDWLASHPEPGQSFEEYVRSRPNLPRGERGVNYLVTVGSLEAPSAPELETLREFQELFFGIPARIPGPLDVTQLRLSARPHPSQGHMQLLTTSLLDTFEQCLPDDAYSMMGLTLTDLYPKESWSFVFGQARLKGRVGIYSFARHFPGFYGEPEGPETPALVLLRALKLMAHETGHMYGIEHCIHYRCLMNGSNSLPESDAAPLHLCPVCLRKLAWVSGLDVQRRYSQLQDWFAAHGLPEQAQWIEQRRAAIEQVMPADGGIPEH